MTVSSTNSIRILGIKYGTSVDGIGLRTSLYCAGCENRCPGCHNPQSWDFAGGQEMSVQELLDIIKDDEFANVTFSGGDPLYQVEAFTELARRVSENCNLEMQPLLCRTQKGEEQKKLTPTENFM